jgi:hypothetical protein
MPNAGFIILNLNTLEGYLVPQDIWLSITAQLPNTFSLTWKTPPSFTYFVNPISGNDSNTGSSMESAWLTLDRANAQNLQIGETVGLLFENNWLLYRTINMTVDRTELTANIITGSADAF